MTSKFMMFLDLNSTVLSNLITQCKSSYDGEGQVDCIVTNYKG